MREVICRCVPGAGVEVTACYFPLTWDYEERRERCQEQYGFECTCSRCKVSHQQSTAPAAFSPHLLCPVRKHLSTLPRQLPSVCSACLSLFSVLLVREDEPNCLHGCLQMEAAWLAEEEAMVSSSEADAQFDLQPESPLAAQESEGTIDEGYVSVFLLRHVCPDEDCLGTLAPDAQGSTTFVCNMCGQSRTYEAFLRELEQGTQHEGSE